MKSLCLFLSVMLLTSCSSTYHISLNEIERVNDKLDGKNIAILLKEKPRRIYVDSLLLGKDTTIYIEKNYAKTKRKVPSNIIIEIRDENIGAGIGYGVILGLVGGSIVGSQIANSVIDKPIDKPKEEKNFDLSGLAKIGVIFWSSLGGAAIGALVGIEKAPANVYILENESNNPGNTFNTTPSELTPGIE